jgi:hypothetical protein
MRVVAGDGEESEAATDGCRRLLCSAAAGSGISPAETGAASSPSAPGPAFSFSSLLQAIEEKIDEKIIGDVRPP